MTTIELYQKLSAAAVFSSELADDMLSKIDASNEDELNLAYDIEAMSKDLLDCSRAIIRK